MNSILNNLASNPKRLFLIDGIGGCSTAFNLGVLLIIFEEQIGMPLNVLKYLASIACLYAIYSLSCYFFLKKIRVFFLKLIRGANLVYCGITAGVLFYHSNGLTILGWSYFIIEILVILTLVNIESKAIKISTE